MEEEKKILIKSHWIESEWVLTRSHGTHEHGTDINTFTVLIGERGGNVGIWQWKYTNRMQIAKQ